ncbi:hypothetical protein A5788_23105 [Gordonia sp. 852002-50816_SCH5313054-c]|uniref:GAF domain-containing protein n=1 Tax=unclassified Gordonia (in: high G+C Gram-positive bacteria) TaxID=2657482 RepID=UPI0007EAB0F0|nr:MULTISPECIES: GAF domain-containing protein [unclassified Gordonia (in: high G+C Gram-positive bacteria)]OBC11223.1 hypothetical protein A5788_23105 [Gordonia sp. 852002-50816_SCH5313054-c]OBC14503.1 hypothetical protein A5786_02595 [Gordonia sp. 852002-50816_SCH5313054-a]
MNWAATVQQAAEITTDLADIRASIISESLGADAVGSTHTAHRYPDNYTPPTSVLESWLRARARGHQRDTHQPELVNADELDRRREQSSLRHASTAARAIVEASADESELVFGMFDADGVMLWGQADSRLRDAAHGLHITEGARWDEESAATTVVGQVLADPRPQRVYPAEHYAKALGDWYCTGAPVLDRVTGDVAGVIAFGGQMNAVQPATLMLAASVAEFCARDVSDEHQRRLSRLRETGRTTLSAFKTALLVDDDGLVADSRGVIAPTRIAPPGDGEMRFVAGLGVCIAERVDGGWVVRPSGPAGPILIELDLRGEPSIHVTDGPDHITIVVTRRHAQILLLLSDAGRAGLTSAQLSKFLFGDTTHEVSVRSEMSRLRRVVGALVSSRPYRLATDVTLTVVPD